GRDLPGRLPAARVPWPRRWRRLKSARRTGRLNPELRLFARGFQDGQQKIAPARGVNPTGAENEMAALGGGDRLLAFELGASVDAQGIRRVLFLIRRLLAPVENVVGRIMH